MKEYLNRIISSICIFIIVFCLWNISYAYELFDFNKRNDEFLNIVFENIKEFEDNIPGDITWENNQNSILTIGFDVVFSEPGQKFGFTTDIVNQSDDIAELESIGYVDIPDEIRKILEYKIEYVDGRKISEHDKFYSNERKKIVVSLEYMKDIEIEDLPSSEELVDLGFSMTFKKYMPKDNNLNSNDEHDETVDNENKGKDEIVDTENNRQDDENTINDKENITNNELNFNTNNNSITNINNDGDGNVDANIINGNNINLVNKDNENKKDNTFENYDNKYKETVKDKNENSNKIINKIFNPKTGDKGIVKYYIGLIGGIFGLLIMKKDKNNN